VVLALPLVAPGHDVRPGVITLTSMGQVAISIMVGRGPADALSNARIDYISGVNLAKPAQDLF
jgi:hypothetical protein